MEFLLESLPNDSLPFVPNLDGTKYADKMSVKIYNVSYGHKNELPCYCKKVYDEKVHWI